MSPGDINAPPAGFVRCDLLVVVRDLSYNHVPVYVWDTHAYCWVRSKAVTPATGCVAAIPTWAEGVVKVVGNTINFEHLAKQMLALPDDATREKAVAPALALKRLGEDIRARGLLLESIINANVAHRLETSTELRVLLAAWGKWLP